jgi:hypothetical protein
MMLAAGLPLYACGQTPTVGPTPQPRPGNYIDADYSYGAISPLVYGSNTGPWQTIGFEQRQMIPALGISTIRWPGGNWGDEHDPSELMIDEYLALCASAGCEPTIHVRLFEGTPAKAAELVRAVNVTRKAGVRYWAIGNEPDLFVKKRGAASYTVAEYAADFIAYRDAMRAVDDSIVVMGPELSQFSPNDSYPRDTTGEYWLRGFIERVPDVEVVSLHRYPFGEQTVSPRQIADEPVRWTESIAYVRKIMREVLGKELPIAITEANSDWSGRVDRDTGTDSYRNALWWTEVLGRLIAAQVIMVNQFCLGAIPAQGLGIFGPVSYNSGPTPIAEAYKLYALFGQTLVHAQPADPSGFLLAARRNDGALTVVCVNPTDRARTEMLTLNGWNEKSANIWRFGLGARFAKVGDISLSDPIELPPLSATLLVSGGA